jgi:nucleoside-diphosphate-sugar epimerase
VARALIVGCGCRGRELGASLLREGWAVRGTSRSEDGLGPIEAAGIEAALADPTRPGTILDLIGDVAVIHWLMGSAVAEPDAVAEIHGSRLEALLERLVDTPVRGFVYETGGTLGAERLERGRHAVLAAAETWRLPVAVVDADPADAPAWLAEMVGAARQITKLG